MSRVAGERREIAPRGSERFDPVKEIVHEFLLLPRDTHRHDIKASHAFNRDPREKIVSDAVLHAENNAFVIGNGGFRSDAADEAKLLHSRVSSRS